MENKEIFDILFLFFLAVGTMLTLVGIATFVFNEIINLLPKWKKTLQEVNNNGK